MARILDRLILFAYILLFFAVPLAMFPKTSEIFEFNKIILTYTLTAFIGGLWLAKMIVHKRIIFRRTILDIPLIIFLASQLLSFLVSIDQRTSLLGYYSRFHGGLISTVSYTLLYWAYVSNIKKAYTKHVITALFSSTVIVSVWAILEHTGRSFSCLIFPEFRTFDVSCWVQDVQTRVYATLGQPNWLAAWIVAIIPLTWAYGILNIKNQNSNIHSKMANILLWILLSGLLFTTLLFTKSRSGILAYAVVSLIFWSLSFWSYLKAKKFLNLVYVFLILNISFLILAAVFGTPWTPNLSNILYSSQPPTISGSPTEALAKEGPALETGGSESGKIRKIVWQGAIDIWKNYPILGSGVETFAFAYYQYRPVEHNLVSEWEYLYNKAHNEYLNYAATTGTVGLIAYLILIGFSAYQVLKNSKLPNIQTSNQTQNQKLKFGNSKLFGDLAFLRFGIFAGYVSILITNFFGFSVVPVALLFFLYPAMAVSLGHESERVEEYKFKKTNALQIVGILVSCSFTLILLYSISKYWYSDYLYAKGKYENDAGNFFKAREILLNAVVLSPNESVFWDELSQSSLSIALTLPDTEEDSILLNFVKSSETESAKAVSLSPNNVNLARSRASLFIKLSKFNPNFILMAKNIYLDAVKLAPTDPKLHYNLSLAYLRTGDYENAIKIMEKTTILKPDYIDAHYSLALMLIDVNEKDLARRELEYILTYLDPENANAKRELDELQP